MWTNIFHPLGLRKGQVEQVTEASGGQALSSLHCASEVLQCLSAEVGPGKGGCKDFAGLSFKSTGLMETKLENLAT